MQKNVIIALAIVGTLTAGFLLFKNKPAKEDTTTTALKDVYNQWKVQYKINVGAAEDDYRFRVFSGNFGKINTHNTLLGRSYTMGLNSFSHLTQEEFSATRLGLKVNSVARNFTALPAVKADKADWTSKMNAVKDQGQCGSCWAFSAVGALEGLHSVNGKGEGLKNVAEQELVDCSTSFGNEGCNGGLMDSAFQYVIKSGGLATQKEYPYTAADGSCKSGLSRNTKITGFTDVKANDPEALKAAIAQQPVAVAIEADTFTFQSYSSGVINDASCGTNLDHGVVAVGFDTTGRIPFYRVRNSWGAGWGDKGHVNIGIKAGAGICGIQQMASYPTL